MEYLKLKKFATKIVKQYIDIPIEVSEINYFLNNRVMGAFFPADNKIVLYFPLLANKTKRELKYIILHEVAHALKQNKYSSIKELNHGPKFQQICKSLGIPKKEYYNPYRKENIFSGWSFGYTNFS